MGMFGGRSNGILIRAVWAAVESPSVQKELEIVDDQKAKITEANENMRQSMQEVFSGMQPPSPDMTPGRATEI